MQHEHQLHLERLETQKRTVVQECKQDKEKLLDELEDMVFKIKDLDNMWDFKYAKLKIEHARLKQHVEEL